VWFICERSLYASVYSTFTVCPDSLNKFYSRVLCWFSFILNPCFSKTHGKKNARKMWLLYSLLETKWKKVIKYQYLMKKMRFQWFPSNQNTNVLFIKLIIIQKTTFFLCCHLLLLRIKPFKKRFNKKPYNDRWCSALVTAETYLVSVNEFPLWWLTNLIYGFIYQWGHQYISTFLVSLIQIYNLTCIYNCHNYRDFWFFFLTDWDKGGNNQSPKEKQKIFRLYLTL